MNSPEGPKGSQTNTLPEIGISQILGLVELLISKGGRDDIYKLAAELSMELGETLTVIKAAELLGLVHTPGGDVVVEGPGLKIIDASIPERKELIRCKLETLPVFKSVRDYLKETVDHEVTREEVLEKLAELIPNEDAESSFSTLVNWGRYAELFGYNDDSQTFYLDSGETTE
ncbi:MAG: AAA-associated domain-containing protein [Bdellovibrionales bacterium]|nr:AAA-associated domain-containing protein [Bdellovibrionales bacterium]